MISHILLSITADNILCALKVASAAIAWITFFKVMGYRRMLKKQQQRDIEAKKMQAQVNDAIEKSVIKE